jgi:hypothetical protein
MKLVHGSGYEIIATGQCSDRTIRRRLTTWASRRPGQNCIKSLWPPTTRSSNFELGDLATDGCITGRSPQRRTETLGMHGADGVPMGIVSAGASRHDSRLLDPAMQAVTHQVGVARLPLSGQWT